MAAGPLCLICAQAVLEKYGPRLKAAFEKGQAGTAKCRDAESVKAAMARMPK